MPREVMMLRRSAQFAALPPTVLKKGLEFAHLLE